PETHHTPGLTELEKFAAFYEKLREHPTVVTRRLRQAPRQRTAGGTVQAYMYDYARLRINVVTPPRIGLVSRVIKLVRTTIAARLCQNLMQGDPAMLEPHGATGQIHAISAQGALAFVARQGLACLGQAGFQRVAPGPQGAGIVRAQVLDIQVFQPTFSHALEHLADMGEFAARKDVFLDELAHTGAQLCVVDATGRNAVVH